MMNDKSVLLIDDEEKLRKLITRIISLEGFKVTEAGSLKEARHILTHKSIDVVLCDVKLPDGNGVDFVKETKEKYPRLEVILLTAYGNIPDGVLAIKNGAFDYITKGDDNDRILPLLFQAMDKVEAHKKTAIKIKEKGTYSFDDVIGESAAIKNAITLAKKIAPTAANVLLLGETGTGKEVFANAIHAGSKRAANAFIAINCSAFAKDLLEGELFGHKAGAYTGAIKDKKGLIELADGGTLFLDEVGEMNIELQAKLLRVIENGEFIKLGDTKITQVDIRIIAATNRDLQEEIKSGQFREDLYYRLNVFSIILPPLRERLEDLPVLVHHFLKKLAQKENTSIVKIDKLAMALLQKHNWKGNIRELKNVLERAVILADEGQIASNNLPYEIQKQSSHEDANNLSLAAIEKVHIQKVLNHTRGNKTETAKLLCIGLTTLYRKIEEYHI